MGTLNRSQALAMMDQQLASCRELLHDKARLNAPKWLEYMFSFLDAVGEVGADGDLPQAHAVVDLVTLMLWSMSDDCPPLREALIDLVVNGRIEMVDKA